jgi:predicted transcriptional regulator of viral defense system
MRTPTKGRTTLDVRLARVAARQHGVVTVAQMRALGFTYNAINHRTRAGRLHRVRHGVYAVGHSNVSWEGRNLAAVLATGPGAVLSHLSAAVLWGLLAERHSRVAVTVDRRVRSRPGIRVHAVRHLDAAERTREAGIPVTTVARTLIDLAAVASEPALRRAVREAQVQRKVHEQGLEALLERAERRHGVGRLAALIASGPAPTRSELEDRTLALLRKHGFPPPAVNVAIDGLPRRVEVDFLFAGLGVILETDGARYHDHRLAREGDAAKQAMLEAAGYRVVRLCWCQATRDVEQTVRRLRHVLPAGASRRPENGAPVERARSM